MTTTVYKDGVQLFSGELVRLDLTTAGSPPPPVTPPPPPPPPPPPVGCTDVFGGGQDADWTGAAFVDTKIFPAHEIEASTLRGTSVKFVADAIRYPNGIVLQVFSQFNLLPKHCVISECPHSFVPVISGGTCEKLAVTTQANFILKFGGSAAWYEAPLTAGQTYYLNFRPTNAGETVATQFQFQPR